MDTTSDEKYERFLKLYQANQDRIFRFIVTLLPHYSAAEDMMQDTMLVMWRKFDQFEEGTNFAAWGTQIARFNITKYYRSSNVVGIRFDDTALNQILEQKAGFEPVENRYLEALEGCVRQLQGASRDLLSLRYNDNMRITDIAVKIGKPLNAIYKHFSRIHHSLYECIERKLKAEGHAL
jgi:RNA polymerase sigma-70 factor (ECF subfamily)